MKKLLLLLPLFLFTCGCWNYRELNTLAISTALAIDKVDDEYQVSVLIANGKNSQTSPKEGQSQTVVYYGKGNTISRALKRINLKIPKDTYLGHLGVVIVSEEIAKDGLLNILDFLIRDPESVKRFYLILAKDQDAKDIIEILSPLESFPGQSIATNIASSKDLQAISTSITYSKFVENLLKKGKEPVLPTITITGNAKKGSKNEILEQSTPDAKTRLDTVAIFKKDKLMGYTTEDESRGINIISNQVEEMITSYKCGEGYIVVNLSNMKTNISNKLVDNKPQVTVHVSAKGAIQEITCQKEIEKTKVIQEIEKKAKQSLKKQIKKAIKIAQEKYKTDIFGFGNLFYKKYPTYFQKVEKKWNEDIFPNIDVKIKTEIHLSTKGSIEKSLIGGIYDY